MSALAGGFLRFTATFFYALEFCCAGIILGIYSYFLATLKNHSLPINRQWKAVEGISGVAVLYTVFAVLLTCFLGGVSIFAFIAIVLDVLFGAAFVALAVLTRQGTESCGGDNNVNTPLGSGPANKPGEGYGGNGFGSGHGETVTYLPKLSFACRLNTACFAVSIIGIVLFWVSAALQIWVARHHRKEKKYGPSPANNYTSGSGRRKFWRRKNKTTHDAYAKDAEMAGAAGAGAGAGTGTGAGLTTGTHDARHSAETGYTGTTQGQNDYYGGANNKYETHTGYHTGPTGTAVNPYGYDSTTRGTASNF